MPSLIWDLFLSFSLSLTLLLSLLFRLDSSTSELSFSFESFDFFFKDLSDLSLDFFVSSVSDDDFFERGVFLERSRLLTDFLLSLSRFLSLSLSLSLSLPFREPFFAAPSSSVHEVSTSGCLLFFDLDDDFSFSVFSFRTDLCVFSASRFLDSDVEDLYPPPSSFSDIGMLRFDFSFVTRFSLITSRLHLLVAEAERSTLLFLFVLSAPILLDLEAAADDAKDVSESETPAPAMLLLLVPDDSVLNLLSVLSILCMLSLRGSSLSDDCKTEDAKLSREALFDFFLESSVALSEVFFLLLWS
mmetsp:Transcript_3925/g.5497  ORF Transcript_3925/g.5497 Transcript_3925/m.5497 type:complete len:301 (-) Transcript_3925:528-1430(-)